MTIKAVVDIEIRAASEEDLDVLSLMVAAVSAASNRTARPVASDRLREALFCEAAPIHALVVTKDGEPIGLAVYSVSGESGSPDNELFVHASYIEPESRGYGYGSLLFGRLAVIAHQGGSHRMQWLPTRKNRLDLLLLGVDNTDRAEAGNWVAVDWLETLAKQSQQADSEEGGVRLRLVD